MVSESAKRNFDKGLTYFHKGEHKSAAELFKKSIMEDPDYSEALYNLAGCYASLGQRDDALVYLNRASKLNTKCLDWAREDGEFDGLRDDKVFNAILEVNDPLVDSKDAAEEPAPPAKPDVTPKMEIPVFEDGFHKNPVNQYSSALPPCLICGGIVEVETFMQYPILLSIGFVFAGTIMAILSLSWISIVIGIPLILTGFYLFMQSRSEWVCQVCGSRGEKAGQPPDWKPELDNQAN